MLRELTDRDWLISLALAVFATVTVACGYVTAVSIKAQLLHHDARDEAMMWLERLSQDMAVLEAIRAASPELAKPPDDAGSDAADDAASDASGPEHPLVRMLTQAPQEAAGSRFSRVSRYRLYDRQGRLVLDSLAGRAIQKRPAPPGARARLPAELLAEIHGGRSLVQLGPAGSETGTENSAPHARAYLPIAAAGAQTLPDASADASADAQAPAIIEAHVDQTVAAARLEAAFGIIAGLMIVLVCLGVLVPAWLLMRRSDEKRSREQQIDFIVRHDRVTGLINRVEFLNRLADQLGEASGGPAQNAVLCLGIDGMKTINTTLGRSVGDAALREVAARCGKLVPQGSLIGRLDGDEIAIALRHPGPVELLGNLAGDLRAQLSEPFDAGGKQLSMNLRVGIAVQGEAETSASELLKCAYVAMNWAKSENAGMVRLFSQDMDTALAQRIEIELGLALALERGEFEVYFQPQFELKTGALKVAEALVRWRHPEMGLISPDRFIPLAERSGLIHELGAWILREACRHASEWPAHVRVAVNLSAAQFSASTLATMVLDILENTGLEPQRLELEITESLFMANMDGVYETLKRLRGAGVGIAMDDFGTGYSSLSYLSRFPFSKLKIDRSFIDSMEEDKAAVSIVQAIIGLGHSLNMTVTAEGVETMVQAEALRAMGCETGQGYLFAKPMPAGAFARLFLPAGARAGKPRLRLASSAA